MTNYISLTNCVATIEVLMIWSFCINCTRVMSSKHTNTSHLQQVPVCFVTKEVFMVRGFRIKSINRTPNERLSLHCNLRCPPNSDAWWAVGWQLDWLTVGCESRQIMPPITSKVDDMQMMHTVHICIHTMYISPPKLMICKWCTDAYTQCAPHIDVTLVWLELKVGCDLNLIKIMMQNFMRFISLD